THLDQIRLEQAPLQLSGLEILPDLHFRENVAAYEEFPEPPAGVVRGREQQLAVAEQEFDVQLRAWLRLETKSAGHSAGAEFGEDGQDALRLSLDSDAHAFLSTSAAVLEMGSRGRLRAKVSGRITGFHRFVERPS